MRVLRNPSQGVEVVFLQTLLNRAGRRHRGRIPPLSEDGIFRRETERAVRAFQALPRTPRLVEDGIVGRRTWRALGLRVYIDHRITLQAQTTDWTCWHAAVSMIADARGQPWSLTTSPEHLGRYFISADADALDEDTLLARDLGWTMLDHTPSLHELTAIMRRTPIYVGGYLPQNDAAHAVVFGGLFSGGDPADTVIKVYDSDPINVGNIYHMRFGSMFIPDTGSSFVPETFLIPP
jgi:hypothetical protein